MLFAAAVAGGLLVVGLRGRPWPLRAGLPGACLAAAATAVAVEQRWIAAVIGESVALRGAREALPVGAAGSRGPAYWFRGRMTGAFHSLLSGGASAPRMLAVLVALSVLGYAAWICRRRRPGWEWDITLTLVVASGLYLALAIRGQKQDMTGLLAAWPLAVLGLASLSGAIAPAAKFAAAVTALFVVAVLATQYRIGGGVEWGARYLSPVLAPLAVLASLGLVRIRDTVSPLPRGRRRVVLGALVMLAVVPSATGLALMATERSRSGRLVDEVTSGGSGLVVTDIVALPRAAWRTHPGVAWMLVVPGELDEAVAALREGGARRVTAVVPAGTDGAILARFPQVDDVTGPVASGFGRRTLELSAP